MREHAPQPLDDRQPQPETARGAGARIEPHELVENAPLL